MTAPESAALEAIVDFRRLPLSRSVRHKLGSIDESRGTHRGQKMVLAAWLLGHVCDRAKGIYVPLSSHPFLKAKLTEDFTLVPTEIRADVGTPFCLFGNPLLLPLGFDDAQFDVASSIKPRLRATNGGFVVVTIEYDCQTRAQFEDICACIGQAGKFNGGDEELRAYRDYRGYTVVFTGNRSLHFHFVFDTRHLKQVPYDQPYEIRCRSHAAHSAFMSNVHQVYWDTALEVMQRILCPPVAADRSMNSYTQFKRTPWGIRELENKSDILGLPKGALVPQLVLAESIRTKRSSRGSDRFIIGADFSVRHYLRARRHTPNASTEEVSAGEEMLNELASMCRSAWGSEFPRPVRMTTNRGEWTIRFQNHVTDRKPSTVACGDFTTLYILGQSAPAGPFVLPGDLSANEMGDHLARRFGLMENDPHIASMRQVSKNLQRLKEQAGKSFKQSYEESVSRSFPCHRVHRLNCRIYIARSSGGTSVMPCPLRAT